MSNVGRKPIYRPETLEIGEKLQLKGPARGFENQYAASWRNKHPGKIFKRVVEKKKVYIQRVA